jgi:hypothetical protein
MRQPESHDWWNRSRITFSAAQLNKLELFKISKQKKKAKQHELKIGSSVWWYVYEVKLAPFQGQLTEIISRIHATNTCKVYDLVDLQHHKIIDSSVWRHVCELRLASSQGLLTETSSRMSTTKTYEINHLVGLQHHKKYRIDLSRSGRLSPQKRALRNCSLCKMWKHALLSAFALADWNCKISCSLQASATGSVWVTQTSKTTA